MDTALPLKQITAVLNLFEAKGMTPERMTEILKSGILADLCDEGADLRDRRAVWIALGLEVDLLKPFVLTLNYDLLRLGTRGNRFDWINPEPAKAESCLITGEGIQRVEARVLEFGESYSTDKTIRRIRGHDLQNRWEPARFEHLLALGRFKHNDKTSLSEITALGTSWVNGKGETCYPVSTSIGTSNRLGISYVEKDSHPNWRSCRRFLVFREIK